ncbi:unnamed protein product [Lepeophtheirus salmonis]|uniref:(salmon louse) hypothetical protein n=1 Tax=Lepeophtheirus salmonis TaxID=72036 RepID=A0A7R8CK90_LEPSM|nr:unnamed protein product [Lepeophtheirus salmonis]CAF2846195.1 unnamed protein product [Lepeophtheirus salmonis]
MCMTMYRWCTIYDWLAQVRQFKPDVIAVHCIIHLENLSSKLINMEHVDSVIVQTVNYIRSRGLNHREIQEFLRHLESQSEDVIYFTEVRWLSRVSTLQRFWLLLDEIILSLKLKQKEINVKLQGQKKLVHDLSKHLRTFERDLQLYEQSLREQKVYLFPTLKSVFNGNNEILDSYAQRVAVLREEFSSRFTEFRNLRSDLKANQSDDFKLGNPLSKSNPRPFNLDATLLRRVSFFGSKMARTGVFVNMALLLSLLWCVFIGFCSSSQSKKICFLSCSLNSMGHRFSSFSWYIGKADI